jgi:hypothetical protein
MSLLADVRFRGQGDDQAKAVAKLPTPERAGRSAAPDATPESCQRPGSASDISRSHSESQRAVHDPANVRAGNAKTPGRPRVLVLKVIQSPSLTLRIKTRSKVEAAGIEPSFDIDATDSSVCDCENCQLCPAARALHLDCFKSHFLASIDADLHYVIEQWERLDASTQRAIATYCRQRTNAGYQ